MCGLIYVGMELGNAEMVSSLTRYTYLTLHTLLDALGGWMDACRPTG